MTMNQSEKSMIRTQRKLLAFPWLKDFFKFIEKSLRITEVTQKQLITYMDNYLSYLKPEAVQCATRPNKAFYLAQSIIETLVLFKNINYEFDLSQEYLSRLHQILGNYVDLELKGSLRGKETVAEITTRIILTLEAHTKPAESINFMYVFLNMRRLQNGHRDILQLLFIRYLKPNITQYEFNDNDFLIYLIVFKLWRNIETCLAEKTKVSELAEKFMKPKSSFRNNDRISRCLPQNSLECHESNAAYYILQNKFNVERLIRILKHNSDSEFYDEEIIDLDSDENTDSTFNETFKSISQNTNTETMKQETTNLANYIDLTEHQQISDKLFWLKELSQNAKNAMIEKSICESLKDTKKNISNDIISLDDEDQTSSKILSENGDSMHHTIESKILENDTSTKLNVETLVNNISDMTSKADSENTTCDNVINVNSNNEFPIIKLTEETSQNISNNSSISIKTAICDNAESISSESNIRKIKNDMQCNVENLTSIQLINSEDNLCKSPLLSKHDNMERSVVKCENKEKRNSKNLDKIHKENNANDSENSNIVFSQLSTNKIINKPVDFDATNTNVVFSVESGMYHKQACKKSTTYEHDISADTTLSDIKITANEIMHLNGTENENNGIKAFTNTELPVTFEFLDESTSFTQNLPELAVGDIVTINKPITHLTEVISSSFLQPILGEETTIPKEVDIVKDPEITNSTIPTQTHLQPPIIYANIPDISPIINSGIVNPIKYAPYIQKNVLNFGNQDDTTFQCEQANLQTINIQQSGLNTNSITSISPASGEAPSTLQTFNLLPTQRSIFVNNLDGSITVMDPVVQQSNVNFNNTLSNNASSLTSQHNQIMYNCSSLLQNNFGNNLPNYNYESQPIPNELQNVNLGYNLGSGQDLPTIQYAQTFHTNQQYGTTAQSVQQPHSQQQIVYPQLNIQNMLNLGNYPINSPHLNNYLHTNQINVQENQQLIPILSYQQNPHCTATQLKNQD